MTFVTLPAKGNPVSLKNFQAAFGGTSASTIAASATQWTNDTGTATPSISYTKGNVGIGTASPAYALDVGGSAAVGARVAGASTFAGAVTSTSALGVNTTGLLTLLSGLSVGGAVTANTLATVTATGAMTVSGLPLAANNGLVAPLGVAALGAVTVTGTGAATTTTTGVTAGLSVGLQPTGWTVATSAGTSASITMHTQSVRIVSGSVSDGNQAASPGNPNRLITVTHNMNTLKYQVKLTSQDYYSAYASYVGIYSKSLNSFVIEWRQRDPNNGVVPNMDYFVIVYG